MGNPISEYHCCVIAQIISRIQPKSANFAVPPSTNREMVTHSHGLVFVEEAAAILTTVGQINLWETPQVSVTVQSLLRLFLEFCLNPPILLSPPYK